MGSFVAEMGGWGYTVFFLTVGLAGIYLVIICVYSIISGIRDHRREYRPDPLKGGPAMRPGEGFGDWSRDGWEPGGAMDRAHDRAHDRW